MKIPGWLNTISPLPARLASYRREYFAGDLMAGLIVAIMLVPQAMAYAMLAGLPPQVGLYASILPVVLYSLFGTSNALAVGPVAMVSLLVLSGVGELAQPGSPEFVSLCLVLALLVGLLQLLMGVFRFGFLVNFISHPVLIGFTSAAAIVIAFSQLKHLLGISIDSEAKPIQLIITSLSHAVEFNPATVLIGAGSFCVLLGIGFGAAPLLKRIGIKNGAGTVISKTGPLVAVIVSAWIVSLGGLDRAQQVAIVGEIPRGLPRWTIPELSVSTVRSLIPLALVITLVGYLESISVAKALASRRREKISPNRELVALGLADLGAAFSGGYPVTGGLSRSLVNYSAGVRTPLSGMITASLVALSVAFLTPWFFYIPKAVLAAIIVVAVMQLVDVRAPVRLWRFSRPDAVAMLVTFTAVLILGIETGILIGVAATIVMLMWKMSRPHVAIVGRVGQSEHFRNVLRHDVQLTEGVLAFRVDESLNFANAPFLESYLQEQIAEHRGLHSVLLISSGINDIDATGIEKLETIKRELETAGVSLYLSDVKGPVMDRLKRARVDSLFLENNVFLSAHEAMNQLAPSQSDSTERRRTATFEGSPVTGAPTGNT